MEFNYSDVKITSSGNLLKQIKPQFKKAARLTDWVNYLIRRGRKQNI